MINKLKKSKKGFTLVELVVVIAILAILAAAAVPAYNGYIQRANNSADLAKLSNINMAISGALAKRGSDVNYSISASNANETATVTIGGLTTGLTDAEIADLNLYLNGSTTPTSPTYTVTATAISVASQGTWTTGVISNGAWSLT